MLVQIGIEVAGAEGYGLFVGRSDGTGVYVDTVGASGVFAYAAEGIGVYGDTTDSTGEWGLATLDKITGTNITLSSITIIAQVTGEHALNPGDVAAAGGVADPLPGSTVSLALVRPADGASQHGVGGVVEERMVLTPQPGHEEETGRDSVLELRSADGAAQPGDYVALTVLAARAGLRPSPAVFIHRGASRPARRLVQRLASLNQAWSSDTIYFAG